MLLAQVPPPILDTSIPVQSRASNLLGADAIDLIDQWRQANWNHGLIRYRSVKRLTSGYQITKRTIPNVYAPTGTVQYIPSTGSSDIQGVADFDGNGVGDFVIQNKTTGANTVWLMKTEQSNVGDFIAFDSAYDLPSTPVGWHMKGVADFDRDGKYDVLWQNVNTGETAIWGINYNASNPAATRFTLDSNKTKFLTTVANSWKMVGWADMNNDNVLDILWQEPSTGNTAIWELTSNVTVGNAYTIQNVGANSGWNIEGVGDYNGDGYNDIVWRNDGINDTVIWKMKRQNGQTVLDQDYTMAVKPDSSDWQITAVTDTNADNIPDILWSNYRTKQNAIWEFKVVGGVPSVDQGFITDTEQAGDQSIWRFTTIGRNRL